MKASRGHFLLLTIQWGIVYVIIQRCAITELMTLHHILCLCLCLLVETV